MPLRLSTHETLANYPAFWILYVFLFLFFLEYILLATHYISSVSDTPLPFPTFLLFLTILGLALQSR